MIAPEVGGDLLEVSSNTLAQPARSPQHSALADSLRDMAADPDAAPTDAAEPGAEPVPEQGSHHPERDGELRPREKHKGPVTLRRRQVESSTTDQRLLDTRGPTDWLHADPWRVLRIQSE